jgi:hypothetical protein
MLIFLEKVEDE